MNILNPSKQIITFEIDKGLYIHNPNKAFVDSFPVFKSNKKLSLKEFTNKLPESIQQFQILSSAIENKTNSLTLDLAAGNKFNIQLSELESGRFIFIGSIFDEKDSINARLDHLETIKMSGDGVILGNSNGEIIYINPKITEFSKYSADDLIGQHISILFSETELKQKPLRFDILEEGKEYLTKRKIRTKNGKNLHVEMLSKKVNDGYITNIRNTEDRIQTENKLEEIRRRLLFVTKLERIGIIDYNLNSNKVFYNEEMCKILDIIDIESCHDLQKWLNHIHPDDQERINQGLEMVKESGKTFEFVYRIMTKENQKTIKASADVLVNIEENTKKLIISSIDISYLNDMRLKLQELEHTFQSFANTATSIIFIYSQKFLYVNRAFERITGYGMKEALKLDFWDIVHPDYKEIVKKRGLKRVSGESTTNHYDFKIINKKGKTIWVDFSAASIKYMGKQAAIGSAFDITDRKELEQKLLNNIQDLEDEKKKVASSENKFQQYMFQNTAAMLVVDVKSKEIIFSNKSAANLYGYSIKELESLKIYNLQSISKEEVDRKMAKAILQSSNEFVFSHIKKDQTIISVKVNASPVDYNNVKSMVLIITDISEELKTKTRLIDSHTSYKNILDSISEMLYILNGKGEFIYINKAAIKNYQYPSEELIGKTPEFVSAPDKNNLEEVGKMLEKAYNGVQNTIYFWGQRKDKSIFPKEVVLSPGYYFGQKVVIAVSRDISEHIKITDELTQAKEKAEESDKLKSAFLANMSHEIRTPMNAILGFSEIIKDPDMDQNERIKFINIINRSSHHLLSLINDLVDLSKIYANQMHIVENKSSLNSLFFEIFEFFESEINNSDKKDHIKLSVSFGLPYGKDVILTDETRLRQVLTNIIGNAIKFTKAGKIHFDYKLLEEFLQFTISDTGIGIPQEQTKNVFNRFVQADQTISKRYGGTGLGLAISQACVELLGGEIWLESEVGKGTNVFFKIPYITSENL